MVCNFFLSSLSVFGVSRSQANWAKRITHMHALGLASWRSLNLKISYRRKKNHFQINFMVMFIKKCTTFIYITCSNFDFEPALLSMCTKLNLFFTHDVKTYQSSFKSLFYSSSICKMFFNISILENFCILVFQTIKNLFRISWKLPILTCNPDWRSIQYHITCTDSFCDHFC